SSILEKEATYWNSRREQQLQADNWELQLAAFKPAEQLLDLGVWSYNTVTTGIFFSDAVFRIFGLPPQGINVHLNVFHSFIHDDDRELAIEYIDKAFLGRLPLQIDFRITRNNGDERYVSYNTSWEFNAKGEMILSGIIKEVSAQRSQDDRLKNAEVDAAFQRHVTNYSENTTATGHYHINLYTRKTIFSDNLYTLYGVKPQSIPASINIFSHYIHIDDRDYVLEAYRKAFYDQENMELEFRVVGKDGKLRHLREKSKMLVNDFNEMIMTGIVQDITVQKKLKDRIQAMKDKLLYIELAQSHDEEAGRQGTWIWNLDDGEMILSDNMYRLLGLKPGTIGITQKYFLKLLHTDDRNRFEAELNAVLKEGKEKQVDIRIVLNGQIRYIKSILKIQTQEDKHIFIAVMRDMTAETQLQQRVAENTTYATLLANSISDRILVTDQYYTIVSCNASFLSAGGWGADDIIGRNIFDVMPVNKATELSQLYQRAFKGESLYLQDVQGLFAKGAFNLSLVPLRNSSDEVTGMLQIIRDVTREHVLQQQFTHRSQLIEKLLDSTRDRIVALDQNMNYTFWNRQAEMYYSMKQNDVIGKNILEVFPSVINDPSYSDFRKVLKGETIHIPANHNGGMVSFQATYLIPLKDERSAVTGILWIVHDDARPPNDLPAGKEQ
ncbi:MAG TPA: PAS domain S-box protein, partial [Flavisolibacter sp.]|nr:PAS domain S-box protein [Flavisolibacter sp.]